MHVEIQVALNFLISFLYNKLPRRRVNQFGEELENVLKLKFEGHWYPEKPYKGSAYRCVRCTPPLDPTVFDAASRACGMDLSDIQENLPQELSIWIDPGEVSYRITEKGPVKILYSERMDASLNRENVDREVIRTLNPEAQCFKPIECLTSQFGGLNVSTSTHSNGSFTAPDNGFKNNAVNGFMTSKNPVTFTTAAFAQTKFGSTKLKSNSKRSHRMSPTEFSNYIKQRALQQQSSGLQIPQPLQPNGPFSSAPGSSPHNSRSLSPNLSLEPANNFLMMAGTSNANSNSGSSSPGSATGNLPQNFSTNSLRNAFMSGLFENNYLTDMIGPNEISKNGITCQNQQSQPNITMNRFASFLDKASPFISAPNSSANSLPSTVTTSTVSSGNISGNSNASFNLNNLLPDSSGNNASLPVTSSPKSYDNINYNLNGVNYSNQFQHLLVAN